MKKPIRILLFISPLALLFLMFFCQSIEAKEIRQEMLEGILQVYCAYPNNVVEKPKYLYTVEGKHGLVEVLFQHLNPSQQNALIANIGKQISFQGEWQTTTNKGDEKQKLFVVQAQDIISLTEQNVFKPFQLFANKTWKSDFENKESVVTPPVRTVKTIGYLFNFVHRRLRPAPLERMLEAIGSTTEPSMAKYAMEKLHGAVQFKGVVNETQRADVYGYLTIRTTLRQCNVTNVIEWIRLVQQTADFRGINRQGAEVEIFGFPNDPSGCPFSGIAPIRTPFSTERTWAALPINTFYGYVQANTLVHEVLGHGFGALHASGLDCSAGAPIPNSCQYSEYGDIFDPMGAGGIGFTINSHIQTRIGFVGLEQTQIHNGETSTVLFPVDGNGSGVQNYLIRLGMDPQGQSVYYAVQYTSHENSQYNLPPGFTVRLVNDPSVDENTKLVNNRQVHANPDRNAIYAVGEEFIDSHRSIRVRANSIAANGGLNLSITVPSP